MEKIKKTIKQALTTGKTETNKFIIIPDLNAIYNFKLSLTQNSKDFGFFDIYND